MGQMGLFSIVKWACFGLTKTLLLGAGHIEDGIEGERIVVRLGQLAKRSFNGLLDRAKSS
jgi:hypothetical protein